MVSVALFAVVMTLSVGTLLTLIDANRKAQSLKSVINNLNFGVDSITRNLRTGHTFYCDDDVSEMPEGTQECPDGASGITFTADTGALVGYQYTESAIERRIVDGGDDSGWISLTAPEVVIDDMLFYVTGASEDDNVQPTVTLSVRGTAGVNTDVDSSFNVQTTVAQRILTESTVGGGGGGGGGEGDGGGGGGGGGGSDPITGAEILIVAGGGGGGASGGGVGGGGGGAGGLLHLTDFTVTGDVTVTVGAGGAGGTAGSIESQNGSNSSISMSGYGTDTAIGGGRGGHGEHNGGSSDGGSGGSGGAGVYHGGGAKGTSGSGTSGQGSAAGMSTTGDASPGGGGKGSVGGAPSGGTQGGVGGTGYEFPSGSGTYYAGGGGGGARGGTGGAGGSGVGGAGSGSTHAASATANRGGGGGGAGAWPYNGGNGGAGVVVIRYAGAQAATGGSVSTAGGYTTHTFTSSGTFTPD